MKMIAGAIVVLAGAVLFAGGAVGQAMSTRSEAPDFSLGFGVLAGLVGLGLLLWGVIEAASGRRLSGPNEALRPPGQQPLPPAPQQGEQADS